MAAQMKYALAIAVLVWSAAVLPRAARVASSRTDPGRTYAPAVPRASEEREAAATVDRTRAIDAVFARWTPTTPGCAVGIAENNEIMLAKAYGSADLEHDVPIRPDTIFEAGSVSQKFTAAAVLLLAHESKLSLDDPVRKYVPELPDYGKPLLIRHMLTRTSGLR